MVKHIATRISPARVLKKVIKGFRRAVFVNKTSSPNLSGDAFAGLCDLTVTGVETWNEEFFQKASHAKSLFLKGDIAESFLREVTVTVHAETVVVGNSDEDFEFDIEANSNWGKLLASHVLIQNLCFSTMNEKYHALPIGLENLNLGGAVSPRVMRAKRKNQNPIKNSRVMVGPFSETHKDRISLFNHFTTDDLFDIFPHRISGKSYVRNLAKYSFCICPRGNGLDTHRFWESLYLGVVPIVLDTPWADMMKSLKIPCLTVSNWNQDEVRTRVLSAGDVTFNPSSVEALWLPFWKNKFFVEV
jgi:hypothetical protein